MLEPFTVIGRRNPLLESDRRLQAIQRGLPDIGGEAPASTAQRWLSAQRNADPEALAPQAQAMLQRMRGDEAPLVEPPEARDPFMEHYGQAFPSR